MNEKNFHDQVTDSDMKLYEEVKKLTKVKMKTTPQNICWIMMV